MHSTLMEENSEFVEDYSGSESTFWVGLCASSNGFADMVSSPWTSSAIAKLADAKQNILYTL